MFMTQRGRRAEDARPLWTRRPAVPVARGLEGLGRVVVLSELNPEGGLLLIQGQEHSSGVACRCENEAFPTQPMLVSSHAGSPSFSLGHNSLLDALVTWHSGEPPEAEMLPHQDESEKQGRQCAERVCVWGSGGSTFTSVMLVHDSDATKGGAGAQR